MVGSRVAHRRRLVMALALPTAIAIATVVCVSAGEAAAQSKGAAFGAKNTNGFKSAGVSSEMPDLTAELAELLRARGDRPGESSSGHRRLFQRDENSAAGRLFGAGASGGDGKRRRRASVLDGYESSGDVIRHMLDNVLRDSGSPAEAAAAYMHHAENPVPQEEMRRRLDEAAAFYSRVNEGEGATHTDADNTNALHAAAVAGHTDRVRRLLDGEYTGATGGEPTDGGGADSAAPAPGLDLHHRGTTHWTALHAAAAEGQTAVVEMLIEERGADPNVECAHGITPLVYAAQNGQSDTVEALLRLGARVDHGKYSALHHAAMQGHAGTTTLLLRAGADPEHQTLTGDLTPLQAAAMSGHDEVVAALLDHGVKLEATDGGGRTAAQHAAVSGHWHIVRRLQEAGARDPTEDPLPEL